MGRSLRALRFFFSQLPHQKSGISYLFILDNHLQQISSKKLLKLICFLNKLTCFSKVSCFLNFVSFFCNFKDMHLITIVILSCSIKVFLCKRSEPFGNGVSKCFFVLYCTQGNCATEGNCGNCESGNCHSGERWMRKPSVHGGK